jgi:hypothetical protein
MEDKEVVWFVLEVSVDLFQKAQEFLYLLILHFKKLKRDQLVSFFNP